MWLLLLALAIAVVGGQQQPACNVGSSSTVLVDTSCHLEAGLTGLSATVLGSIAGKGGVPRLEAPAASPGRQAPAGVLQRQQALSVVSGIIQAAA
jgi:hypothetical protein